MVNNTDRKSVDNDDQEGSKTDEKIGVMVYGNLRIIDVDTGELLVNKRA